MFLVVKDAVPDDDQDFGFSFDHPDDGISCFILHAAAVLDTYNEAQVIEICQGVIVDGSIPLE